MHNNYFGQFTKILVISLIFISGTASATLIFNNEALFNAQLSSSIKDDYTNPAYVFNQNNLTMSAVLGETDYRSTGHNNVNIVTSSYYCAGCNGSFELGFTTTSIGNSSGVFGVGFNIFVNSLNLPYDAFITFGDTSTLSLDLGTGSGFFGVTSALLIKSIHFGLSDGSTTSTNGSFAITDLTIGVNEVPEPGSIALLTMGLLGLVVGRRRKLL